MDVVAQGKDGDRNRGIDVFRGLLIVLVIIGHFFELTHRYTFFTWLGFGVRMPLLIGLAGYLFKLEEARTTTFAMLVRHYRRLIVPWLLACIVYVVLVQPIDWRMPVRIILQPPFHLWFVPVVLAFVLIGWACRLRRGQMLALAVPVSIAAMYVFGVGHAVRQYHPWVPDRRYFIYPIYFTLGLWVAHRPADPNKTPLRLAIAAIGLIWWCALYHRPSAAAEVAAELLLCVPLISMLPRVRALKLNIAPLAVVGRDSLFFYLWHPLVFGLWAASGLPDLLMLGATALSLALGWGAIARAPSLREIVGIRAPAWSQRIRPRTPAELSA